MLQILIRNVPKNIFLILFAWLGLRDQNTAQCNIPEIIRRAYLHCFSIFGSSGSYVKILSFRTAIVNMPWNFVMECLVSHSRQLQFFV